MVGSSRTPWDALSYFQWSYMRPSQASTPWPQATSLTLGKLALGPLPRSGPGKWTMILLVKMAWPRCLGDVAMAPGGP